MASTQKNNVSADVLKSAATVISPFPSVSQAVLQLPGVVGFTFGPTVQQISKQLAVLLALRKVYRQPVSQSLTLKEAKACSDLAYKGNEGDTTSDGYWTIMQGGVKSTWITGFRAIVLTAKPDHDIRVVLAFAGTDPKSPIDLLTDLEQALNFNPINLPTQYDQAASLAAHCLQLYGGRLRVTGHSLGGGLASFVSVKFGIPGAGINAAPLGAGSLLNLLLFGKNNRSKFTQYNNNGEMVSSYAPGMQLGQVCQMDSNSGLVAGHFLENINTNAPMVCYDDYFKKGSRGVTATWGSPGATGSW